MLARNRVYQIGLCILAAVYFVLALPISPLAAPHNSDVAQPSGYYYSFPNSGSGVNFLTVQTNVRSRGMGEVSAALTDNPTGFVFNPASLTSTHQFAVCATYSNWLTRLSKDIILGDLTTAISLSRLGAFGLSARFIIYDKASYFEGSSYLGSFKPYTWTLTAGYAIDLKDNFAAGANLKILRDKYGRLSSSNGPNDLDGNTIGFDFGIMILDILPDLTITDKDLGLADPLSNITQVIHNLGHARDHGLSFGFCIRNLGPRLVYSDRYDAGEPMPHHMELGFAYRAIDTDPFGLLVAADFNSLIVTGLNGLFDYKQINCGAEFSILRLLDIRGGSVHSNTDGSKYLTFGLGVGFDKFKLNYSYIPDGQDAGLLAKTSFFELNASF